MRINGSFIYFKVSIRSNEIKKIIASLADDNDKSYVEVSLGLNKKIVSKYIFLGLLSYIK